MLRSLIPSIVVLGSAAVLAALLSTLRTPVGAVSDRLRVASRLLLAATAIQAMHFAEEWATGFPAALASVSGFPPMPTSFFVGFNLAWLVAWIGSVAVLHRGHSLAMFAAWFLAIAAVVNGFAHPLLAIMSSGYFPGLYTSPAIGIAGYLLSRALLNATASA